MRESVVKFEAFCQKLLEIKGYTDILREADISNGLHADYIATSPENYKTAVEVKFYGSSKIPLAFFRQVFEQLKVQINRAGTSRGLIITTANIGASAVESVTGTYIEVWDHGAILRIIDGNVDLLQEYSDILQEGKIFRAEPESSKDDYKEQILDILTPKVSRVLGFSPAASITKGQDICADLKAIPEGRTGAEDFEKKCTQAVQYIFSEDLTAWRAQPRTVEGLFRFDLIARISSESNFWKNILSLHRTQYVIFEFKNYANEIGQGEIYSTEKYLYPRAMRSFAIMIARNGANDNALSVARGALRENGKIIIVLSLDEICKLLHARDNGDDPSDILAEILDEMMMKIER